MPHGMPDLSSLTHTPLQLKCRVLTMTLREVPELLKPGAGGGVLFLEQPLSSNPVCCALHLPVTVPILRLSSALDIQRTVCLSLIIPYHTRPQFRGTYHQHLSSCSSLRPEVQGQMTQTWNRQHLHQPPSTTASGLLPRGQAPS